MDTAVELVFLARIQAAARVRHVTGRAITAIAVSAGVLFAAYTVLALFYAARSLPESSGSNTSIGTARFPGRNT